MFGNRQNKNRCPDTFYTTVDNPFDGENLACIDHELAGPLIHADREVLGGVYIPTEARDPRSVVVDSDDRPEIYETFTQKAKELATNSRGRINSFALLRTTNDVVRQEMVRLFRKRKTVESWDESTSERDGRGYARLSDYMEGFGSPESHHLALAAAATLEKLIVEGELNGQVSLETGARFDQNDVHNKDKQSVRCWVRLTDQLGKVWILDPKENYVGSLEESSGKTRWTDYRRPEDYTTEYEADENITDIRSERHRRLGLTAVAALTGSFFHKGRHRKRAGSSTIEKTA